MKLNEKIAAQSLAIVGGAYYLICTILVFIAPGLYKSIAISWAHGVDIAGIWRETPPDIGTMVIGFITFTISAWVTGYAFAWVYNYLGLVRK